MKTKLTYSLFLLMTACGGAVPVAVIPDDRQVISVQSSSPAAIPSVGAISTVCMPPAAIGPDAQPIPSGVGTGSVSVGGLDRTYTFSVPVSRPDALPLIFVFSDDHGTGAQIREALALEAPAEGRAIFVYPDGDPTALVAWDSTSAPDTNRDLLLFDVLLAKLKSQFCISSIFAAGYRRGAHFTNYLGCQRGDQLRAIAVEGGNFDDFNGEKSDDGVILCPTPAVSAFVIDDAVTGGSWVGAPDFKHWMNWNHPSDRGDYATLPVDPPGCLAAQHEPPGHEVLGCFIVDLGDTIWPLQAQMVWDFFYSAN